MNTSEVTVSSLRMKKCAWKGPSSIIIIIIIIIIINENENENTLKSSSKTPTPQTPKSATQKAKPLKHTLLIKEKKWPSGGAA
jgi:hypothetical protein